jgi:hypothetical protein
MDEAAVFPKPLPLCVCLAVCNGRWAEARVGTLPWSVWLKTLKGDLMETMELN